jgi:hypothetical protein
MSKFCFFASLILVITIESLAQKNVKNNKLFKPQKNLSFNPLALAEPQAAASLGFSYRIKTRSGYFTELSYIFKAPFYGGADPITGGYRWLLQYRYSLLKKRHWDYFWGAEFRLKGYGFTGTNTFVNKLTNDTLKKYNYKANATSIGGAVLFGVIFDLNKNSRWQMEMTFGIGAKQKFVKYKKLPEGYELLFSPFERKGDVLGPPDIDEPVGMPYLPLAIRVRYRIR